LDSEEATLAAAHIFVVAYKKKVTVNSEIYNSRELLKIEKCVLVERH